VYSMNVVSPLVPQFSLFFRQGLGAYEATFGQYEGMNYLGFGVWMLIVLGAWAARRHLPGLVRRHVLLLVLMTAFTLYAWSNVVYVGRLRLFEYPLGPFNGLAQQFRASGRFFWPVAYFLLLAGTWAVARHG